jgi:hypothetical protein
VISDRLDLDPGELTARTGWQIKPQGACMGDVCVPLPAEVMTGNGRVDATVLAERMRMPLLRDDAHGVWSLGPAAVTGRSLTTADAPDLTLPDIDGNPFTLSSLHAQKVLLVAWASW